MKHVNNKPKHEIGLLNFIRGWAAILVFFHHAAILGGGNSFLKGHIGHEAVNLFMLASGFLIYFQCSVSSLYHGLSNNRGRINFYIRRFFRIAPAYYVLLIAALLLSNYLGDCRIQIADKAPNSETSLERYYIANYYESFLVHASFMFGIIPKYSFSTPLPDWSLGLEMQFYLIFPALYLFYKRNFTLSLLIFLVGFYALKMLTSKAGIEFPMPSFLPLKFHNFSAGIALAYLLVQKPNTKSNIVIITITLIFLLLGNRTLYIPACFIGCWLWICHRERVNLDIFSRIESIFSGPTSKFLAEASYSIYLLHLMIMIPAFAIFTPKSSIAWTGYTLCILAITTAVAWLIYKLIEVPGISLGKRLVLPKPSYEEKRT